MNSCALSSSSWCRSGAHDSLVIAVLPINRHDAFERARPKLPIALVGGQASIIEAKQGVALSGQLCTKRFVRTQ